MEGFARALQLAYEAHKGTYRKGTGIPYIIHPIDVACILLREGASEDLAIAGLLHDIVEDSEVRLDEIEKEFGRAVSNLVRGVTEPEKLNKNKTVRVGKKKDTWKKRKMQTISRTRAAGRDLKLLECADKLANFKDIIRDYNKIGGKLWDRFNASPEDQRWYYESMVGALGSSPGSLEGTKMYGELKGLVAEFFDPT